MRRGFTLIELLIALALLSLAATGAVAWQKKSLAPTSITTPTPPPAGGPTPTPTTSPLLQSPGVKIKGPTVIGPVTPGVFEGDLRNLPTTGPPPTSSTASCSTDNDCWKNGTPAIICEAPCMLKCINNRCLNVKPTGPPYGL